MSVLVNTRVSEEAPGIWVKHEEECSPYPGPGFSKIRGVYAHIAARPEAKVIGVLDTYHSRGGWAVAYCAEALGRQCINYYPQFVADLRANGKPVLRRAQQEAGRLGAQLVALGAGRSAVIYHRAKADLASRLSGGSYMMPNALKLPETVVETEAEFLRTPWRGYDVVVISISSATIACGVLCGIRTLGVRPHVILHMGYSRPVSAVWAYVKKMTLAPLSSWDHQIVDEGYSYKDKVRDPVEVGFPCSPYYDLKAYSWVLKNSRGLSKVLFWNVG